MRTFLRLFPFIGIFLMLGCSAVNEEVPPAATAFQGPSPTAVVLATGRPATPEPPAPTPEPTAPPEEVLRQIETLDRIDHDTAILYAGTDRFLLHQFFRDPEANGAVVTGPFILEDSFRDSFTAAADTLRTNLDQLDREVLGEPHTVVYDALERFLSSSVSAFDNPYIADPFSDNGFILSIPERLSLFRIETEEDVQFLADTIRMLPSCVNEAISIENGRISDGYRRNESRLSALIEWCDGVIDEKSGVISKAIKDNINKADGLTRKQKKSYVEEFASLLKENLIPAVRTLRENAAEWKKQAAGNAFVPSEESRAYYKAYLSWITQSEASPETITESLLSAAEDLTYTLASSAAPEGDAFKGSRISGSIITLKRITKEMVADVPDSGIKLVKVSDKLSAVLSGPYVLSRPFLEDDGGSQQNLYYSEEGIREGLFPDVAMVYYPGEALLDSVGRASDRIGMFQKAFAYPCYRKGWACYAAEQAVIRQTTYEAGDALYAFSRNLLFGEVLPALADIQINYLGYDRDQLGAYLNAGSLELSDEYVSYLYEESVDCPGKHIPAAYGYSVFCDIMKRMSAVLGERYTDSAVHAKLLSIGPCGLDIVRELMDEWADGQIAG